MTSRRCDRIVPGSVCPRRIHALPPPLLAALLLAVVLQGRREFDEPLGGVSSKQSTGNETGTSGRRPPAFD